MTLEERRLILAKPVYTYRDICVLADVGHSQAYKIMRRIVSDFDGAMPDIPGGLRPDAVWRYFGSSLKEQIELFGQPDSSASLKTILAALTAALPGSTLTGRQED